MRILVMGTGGTGGYYGGLLAKQGHDVTFVARGEQLRAIQSTGLQVKSIHGDFAVAPAKATDDPSTAEAPELILFCVKTYSTDQAVQQIRPIVRKETAILSLQNGIDAHERIGRTVGMERMIGGTTWISAAIEAPGVIKQVSRFRRVVIGELDGSITPRAEAIHSALHETGITAETSGNILKVIWTKFVFIVATSSLGSLTRLPIGGYRGVPETREQIKRLLREAEAVARRQGIDLDANVVEQTMAFIDNNAPHVKPSMQLDVEAGRRTEVESLVGAVVRKGREAGVPTPAADSLYALLLPADLKAREQLQG
jgi:2-dehydropantoate 2-reductase